MKFRGGEFSTGTTGNFQPELTCLMLQRNVAFHNASHCRCSARRPSSPSPNTVAIKLVKSILVFP